MHLSRYVKIYPSPEQPGKSLIYSTKRSSALLLDERLVAGLRRGMVPEKELDTMARLGILVPDLHAEREEMRGIFDRANAGRRKFNAAVTLNLDCNLDCPYCFEANFRGKRYMSADTVRLVVDTVRRDQIGKGRDVSFTFYGGEALLSTGLIREIAQPLRQAASGSGVSFSFGIITNGTLLSRKVAEELLPLGLSGAKITLDGPRELHDKSRPFASGLGSYEAIVKNILAVCDIVPLRLGGNFTRDNYREYPRLLDDLARRGITPDKVQSVLFVPITGKAGGKGKADFGGECVCGFEPWLVEASLFLREETLRRGYAAPKPRICACMVEYDHDVVINYDGSLYKCPAFMGYEELKIGDIASGAKDCRKSHGLELWKKDECLDCAYLPLCFGGCRFMTLLRNGAINEVDCRKQFYDAALETIVRQDLKYQRSKQPREKS